MTQREERTKWISLNVTESVFRELEVAKDNQTLRDDIIKRFVSSEASWLEDEMKLLDEQTVRYRSRLLGIRDAFAKAQDEYVSELEAIARKATETFDKVDGFTKTLHDHLDAAKRGVAGISDAVGRIDVSTLERLLAAVERFNAMKPDEKELVSMLANPRK